MCALAGAFMCVRAVRHSSLAEAVWPNPGCPSSDRVTCPGPPAPWWQTQRRQNYSPASPKKNKTIGNNISKRSHRSDPNRSACWWFKLNKTRPKQALFVRLLAQQQPYCISYHIMLIQSIIMIIQNTLGVYATVHELNPSNWHYLQVQCFLHTTDSKM